MKPFGKHTFLGWSWRTLVWVVLTPLFLCFVLSVLLYVPPIQKWAVDRVAEVLSEELDMDVSVGHVRLRFPLDLTMGDILAVQKGDTVLDARELSVNVRALPLLRLQAEVDGIHIYDAKINTSGLLDACVVKGTLAELSLNSHSTDIRSEHAVINRALLRDADFTVLLADSVPEDTTTEEPTMWRLLVEDVNLQKVKVAVLLAPQADSVWVAANVGDAHASAFLDLGKGVYQVPQLRIKDSEVAFDQRKVPRRPEQFDPNHLHFKDVALEVDSFDYRDVGTMQLDVKRLVGVEQTGLSVTDLQARVEMDSLTLQVPSLHVRTDDSDLNLSYRMDFSAFSDINPGKFSVTAQGQIGKGDLVYFTRMGGEATKEVCATLNKMLPVRPTEVVLRTDGNLQTLEVERFYVKVPEMALVEGKATLWNVAEDLSMQAVAKVKDAWGGAAEIDGRYTVSSEEYDADVVLNTLSVNRYVPMDDTLLLSGKATVSGRGFDFFSPQTTMKATANLTNGRFGQIDLSHIDVDASLRTGKVKMALLADNEQVQTDFAFDGEVRRHLIDGLLSFRLPHLDARKMGFSDETLTVSTGGVVQFSYNLDKLFRVDSQIEALDLAYGENNIVTDAFHLFAEAKADTTTATLRSGDLFFSFFAPHNMFRLLPKVERLQKEAVEHFKQRKIDLNGLKAYLPEISMHVSAGNANPLADILRTYGIKFNKLSTDVETSSLRGLIGRGHVYAFQKDSLVIDTARFDIVQDSTQLDYSVGVRCNDHPQMPAFRAFLEGYVKADEVDAHLTYFNKRNRKGVDLGVRGVANDSTVTYRLYPEKPVIAFREYAVNADNYIVMRPEKPILSDIRLVSTSDSCYLAVYSEENEQGKQIANLIINDLNLSELLTVMPVPNLPQMAGMLQLDATYIEQEDNFHVEGSLNADRFTYEGVKVGDLASRFIYAPQGADHHTIDATLAYNERNVLQLGGVYDARGVGALDAQLALLDVPMSLLSPFVPEHTVSFRGSMAGDVKVTGPVDALLFNGALLPKDVQVLAPQYNVNLSLANDSIKFVDSYMEFDSFKFYGADENPLTLNGHVDFSRLDNILLSLSISGRNFKLVEAKPNNTSLLYGQMYGDFFARVIGSTKDLTIRGLVRVLPTTDLTYVMSETALYQADRLEDIVTFVDFDAPPPPRDEIPKTDFTGVDMTMTLSIEDGAKLRGEFSADKQSYVNVQGGGTITMTYTPEGVLSMQGRYTINEGEMKYTLPVIPLRTFTIHPGSYIEFLGDPANPMLNIAATERVKAVVGADDGASRSVSFDTGLKITNTLSNMGLEFTIDAPEDQSVQNELAGYSVEEKNKLAVGMLATGMYLSGKNRKGFTAGNALNSFLQNEINNIAGKAMSTMVDVNVGMEQTTRDDGTTRTDYSFKFSRRFFSDRLNVVIGGKVSTDGDKERDESGAYIDDVSLEWRLDNGRTQYIRLFHEKDFSNLIEGELDKNGVGVLLRRKVDRLSDLLIWKRKEEESVKPTQNRE